MRSENFRVEFYQQYGVEIMQIKKSLKSTEDYFCICKIANELAPSPLRSIGREPILVDMRLIDQIGEHGYKGLIYLADHFTECNVPFCFCVDLRAFEEWPEDLLTLPCFERLEDAVASLRPIV